jgi:hypothetical protein
LVESSLALSRNFQLQQARLSRHRCTHPRVVDGRGLGPCLSLFGGVCVCVRPCVRKQRVSSSARLHLTLSRTNVSFRLFRHGDAPCARATRHASEPRYTLVVLRTTRGCRGLPSACLPARAGDAPTERATWAAPGLPRVARGTLEGQGSSRRRSCE